MASPRPMLTVVAAIIQQNDRILICQRSRTGSFPLNWEFPGGKVEPGETPQQALSRELQEELGVASTIGSEHYRTRHQYAELPGALELIFFDAQISAPPRNLAFEQILWELPAALRDYDFLPADRELVARLAANAAIAGPPPSPKSA